MAEKKTARGHNLETLFCELSPGLQGTILMSIGIRHQEFFALLKENARAFEQWRYVYEAEHEFGGDLDFLFNLSRLVNLIPFPAN
jgi:hypothetical protein